MTDTELAAIQERAAKAVRLQEQIDAFKVFSDIFVGTSDRSTEAVKKFVDAFTEALRLHYRGPLPADMHTFLRQYIVAGADSELASLCEQYRQL